MTPPAGRNLWVLTGGFLSRRHRMILALAGWRVRPALPGVFRPGPGDRIGVWGRSALAWRGEALAARTGLPLLRVEDPFLRSLHPGRAGSATLGLLLDETGVHFDASAPSDIETLLETADLDASRGAALIERLRHADLGKYAAADPGLPLPAPGYALVIDQVAGDASLPPDAAARFAAMLAAAREAAPRVVIKSHPETALGRRPGLWDGRAGAGIEAVTGPVSPGRLLEGATSVWTISSAFGLDAILRGHRPETFGSPAWAGWGLSEDRETFPRRTRRLSPGELAAGLHIAAPVWIDPATGTRSDAEGVVSLLAAEARAWREDRHGWVMAAVSGWKRPWLSRALGHSRWPGFAPTAERALDMAEKSGRRALVWAAREDDPPPGVWRMEDGALRSRGLGAALVPPVSIALDDLGIAYDPRRESRLERLIAESVALPEAERARAASLVDALLAADLTKYGLEGARLPELPPGRRILAVGQVPDDAALRLGTSRWRTNADLLREARARNPDATLIWRPHPDVTSGLRDGADDTDGLADITISDAHPGQVIAAADEVWTLTSTMGFEALLRGKPVTVLGAPFYAGWGLTRDLAPTPPRRRARPDVTALAHAALIGYPRYFDPATGAVLSPEQAVRRLAETAPGGRPGRARLGRLLRRLFLG